jgi:hypothetical protein
MDASAEYARIYLPTLTFSQYQLNFLKQSSQDVPQKEIC